MKKPLVALIAAGLVTTGCARARPSTPMPSHHHRGQGQRPASRHQRRLGVRRHRRCDQSPGPSRGGSSRGRGRRGALRRVAVPLGRTIGSTLNNLVLVVNDRRNVLDDLHPLAADAREDGGELGSFEVDLHLPIQEAHALEEFAVRGRLDIGERVAANPVEPDADDAAAVHGGEFVLGDVGRDDGGASQASGDRVERRSIARRFIKRRPLTSAGGEGARAAENKIAGNVIPELARKALNAPSVGPREVSDLNFLALDKGSNPEGSYSLPGVRWSA
jgi:hypothetical protein